MTEIKVISDKTTRIDLGTISAAERTIYFEDIINENPSLGIMFINNLEALIEEIIEYEARIEMPTIWELMLIKIVMHGAIPIIDSFKNRTTSVVVKFNTRVRAVTSDGLDYMIPAGEEVGMQGFIIAPKCAPKKTLRIKSGVQSLQIIGRSMAGIDKTYGIYPLNKLFCANQMAAGDVPIRDDISITPTEGVDDIYTATKFTNAEATAIAVLTGLITREMDSINLFPLLQCARNHNYARKLNLAQYEYINKPYTLLDPLVATLQAGDIIDTVGMIIAGVESTYYRAIIFGRDDKRTAAAIAARRKYISDISAIKKNTIARAKILAKERITVAIIKQLFGSVRSLTKSETKLVNIELERREKHFREVINNKCDHVRLLRAMHNAVTTIQKKSAWFALKKYFGRSGNNTHVVCSNCKYDIMCNHEVIFIDNNLADRNYAEIKAKLMPFLLPGSRKCKHCGMVISKNIESINDMPPQDMDENILSIIYGELNMLMRHITFNTIVNINKMVAKIKEEVYSYVYDTERLMSRSKTITADEMRPKMQLYTCIYVAATLIHIILGNKQITLKGFVARNKNTVIIDMLKYMIDIIVSSKNIAIRDIAGMNKDIIKSALINAYKSIQSTGLIIVSTIASDDPIAFAIFNPLYRYLYTVGLITGHFRKHVDRYQSIQYILPNIKNKTKGVDPYSGMVIPKIPAARNTDTGPDLKIADIKLILDALLWQQKLANVHIYKNTGVAEAGSNVHGVVFSDQYSKYLDQMDAIVSAESARTRLLSIKYSHLFMAAMTGSSTKFRYRNTKLGRLYDENGRRHEWTKYVDSEGNVLTKPLGFADIKCNVCGIMRSQCDRLDDNKIKSTLRLNIARDNFFIYYENKCPHGGIHESRPCKKCGYDGIDDTYLSKYMPNYIAEKRPQIIAPITKKAARVNEPVEPFVENFGVITELATLLGINHKLITSLCSTENVNYKHVVDGTIIPRESNIRFEPRVYLLDTIVRNFLVSYMQLRNLSSIIYPPRDLVAIVEGSGFPKHRLIELSKLLPLVGDGYIARFNHMQWTLKSRLMSMFCIQSLCEISLQILNDSAADTLTLRTNFVANYFKKIIRQDELVSKPGYFSWTLLYGDREPKVSNEIEVTNTADFDDETETNPFDLGNLDLEDEDPDDANNLINVEGYGLS